jgi:hypothetical protein
VVSKISMTRLYRGAAEPKCACSTASSAKLFSVLAAAKSSLPSADS